VLDDDGDDDQAQHFMFLSFIFNVFLAILKNKVSIVFENHVDCKLSKVSKLYNTCFPQS